MLTSSNFKMTFSFAIATNIAITTLKKIRWERRYKEMESLNLNKLLNRFLDWKITFILYCGKDLPTDLYKRSLKLKEKVPKNGRTTNNFLLGTVCIFLFREAQFVQNFFDTLINYINRIVITNRIYFSGGTNFEKPEQKHMN